jgi:hypothetical protein
LSAGVCWLLLLLLEVEVLSDLLAVIPLMLSSSSVSVLFPPINAFVGASAWWIADVAFVTPVIIVTTDCASS